ncbi:MAG TPA: aminoglycoside 6'-N-acetyltransferase [Rhizomicrobium sp.]|nr:aminoglycoside 6'-N-acetyltransferase [Rhizomicrobium sp.]
MASVEIRPMERGDARAWAQMRLALWPEAGEHAQDMERILTSADEWAFLAEADGVPAGFAEISVRKFANGCETAPVPFLEGIWVEPELRRRGVGRALVDYVEAFVRARGFREIGSDALLGNRASHAAHAAWGFSETERVVYFRKGLDPA